MNILHKADVHAPTLTILIRPLQNWRDEYFWPCRPLVWHMNCIPYISIPPFLWIMLY